MPERITAVLGHDSDPELEAILHFLGHDGGVEYITFNERDMARKRLRAVTDRGTECAIALPRDVSLQHGAVLLLDEGRAIVVRLEELPWLVFEASDRAAALRLGFLAGHHHWRVRFDGTRIKVAQDQARERYLERLRTEIDDGSIRVVEDDGD